MEEEQHTLLYIYLAADYYPGLPSYLKQKVMRYNKNLDCYNHAANKSDRGYQMLYNRYVKLTGELDKAGISYIERS